MGSSSSLKPTPGLTEISARDPDFVCRDAANVMMRALDFNFAMPEPTNFLESCGERTHGWPLTCDNDTGMHEAYHAASVAQGANGCNPRCAQGPYAPDWSPGELEIEDEPAAVGSGDCVEHVGAGRGRKLMLLFFEGAGQPGEVGEGRAAGADVPGDEDESAKKAAEGGCEEEIESCDEAESASKRERKASGKKRLDGEAKRARAHTDRGGTCAHGGQRSRCKGSSSSGRRGGARVRLVLVPPSQNGGKSRERIAESLPDRGHVQCHDIEPPELRWQVSSPDPVQGKSRWAKEVSAQSLFRTLAQICLVCYRARRTSE
jgi:hypothetical protein